MTWSFDAFFDLCLNRRLSKQSWGWWFETLSSPLWRHCNDKDHSSRYRDSHYEDKTLIRQSYLYDGDYYTGKTASLYWDDSQILSNPHYKDLTAYCPFCARNASVTGDFFLHNGIVMDNFDGFLFVNLSKLFNKQLVIWDDMRSIWRHREIEYVFSQIRANTVFRTT